jgi:hypothetical protein
MAATKKPTTKKPSPAKKTTKEKATSTVAATPEVAAPTTVAAPSTDASAATASPFKGKTVVLTGSLITMKRNEAEKLLVAAGATIGSGVTKTTDLLIYGDKAGSKLAAAKKLNVALMTEAEMVAILTKSSPAAQSSLGDAAKKIAEAEAEDKKRMAGVRADIDAANAEHLKTCGMTVPQMLLKYLQVFIKRPDVFVTNNNHGRPASSKLLLRWHKDIPAEWLAFHSEIGSLHFGWIFAKDKAERSQYSEGHKGGRLVLQDPERIRWWPQQDYQKDLAKASAHYNQDFKEEALFDDFVNEGRALLSYGKKEKPVNAELIFDNTNDCVRHPMGTIFNYLTNGARVGFTWYWQSNSRDGQEFTATLLDASLPKDTPAETIDALLQKQGLSANEAKALRTWLGDSVVILLPLSLTPDGAAKQKRAERFPGLNRPTKRSMDLAFVEQLSTAGDATKDKDWKKLVADHKEFLASGGSGGRWELLAVSGLPLCVYVDAEATKGKQLVLRLKKLAKLSAKGADLSYADLSGAYYEGIDFSEADLSHSVLTDAIFVGANFKGADLTDADFSGSRLHNANFEGATLEGTDFEGCDLTGANFSKTDTLKAKFPGAIIKDVKE